MALINYSWAFFPLLQYSYNEPGVEGAIALAQGLRHVTCLMTLELWSVVLYDLFLHVQVLAIIAFFLV
jgi:hypothetical protein